MGKARAIAALVGAACLLLAAYMFAANRDERRLASANAAGLRGDYPVALRDAATVSGAAARGRADLVEAYALAAMYRYAPSAGRFAAAAREDPQNWVVRRDWARVLLAAGRRHSAQVQIERALALNPRMRLPPGFVRSSAR